ncbi:MAG TPA: LUD domain-containing protein [Spirochaetia bacterium]|nr:LUD domain-containing protein [Spirochaetia bacterium]
MTAVDESFAVAAEVVELEQTVAALQRNGFMAELLADAQEARARIRELVPQGAAVLTAASETLRLSGIYDDINTSGRYDAVVPRVHAMDQAAQADVIRRLRGTPDVAVGSVAAVTQTGTIVVASATSSQIPAYAGGARCVIWIVGAQKVVPDLATALRRVETYAYPLEDARARAAYGRPTAINRLLIVNGEPFPGRSTVLLLREAIGY